MSIFASGHARGVALEVGARAPALTLLGGMACDGENVVPAGPPRLVFASARDGNCEIYVMDADGSALARITNSTAFDFSPTWSPEGSTIAFASDRDGAMEIHAMQADGSAQTRLTNTGAPGEAPAWSPDGSKLAFESYPSGNRDVYVMNANGTAQTGLTTAAAFDGSPAWAPDGP